jgi:hypothetical protein
MKRLIGVAFCVVLLILASLIIRGQIPKRVAADVLIEEAGQYRSPNGVCLVDVWEENEGELKFFVYQQKEPGPQVPAHAPTSILDAPSPQLRADRIGSGPAKPFRAESDWFMCWDSQDRLWTYVPEQDLSCCSFWQENEDVSGSCLVGDAGGWEGIP